MRTVKDEALTAMRHFFHMESASGILLILAAALAMLCANTPLVTFYNLFLETRITVTVNDFGLSKALIFWINDGLMAVFFMLIGLEIKREILEGELSGISQALLPAIAAAGGVLLPALIYSYLNQGNPDAMRGWAIPSATDIAFSLGVLSLFGNRVPVSLKVFLMAVAVIDDLIAIIIIALFYTQQISMVSLAVALTGIVGLSLLHIYKVRTLTPYMLIGLVVWMSVLKSGVHATIAGVILGLFIPYALKNREGESMLRVLEHALHPWVAFMILPIFAFANAGISFEGLTLESLLQPVPLGIAAGLFIGKQLGIFLFTWLMVMTGMAPKPEGASWAQLYGVCIIAGVGFTMSLFIGSLAFAEASMTEVRLGVLTGSFVSAITGYLVLRMALKSSNR